MTADNDLIEHLRDEETCAAAHAIASRIEAIENLPDGPVRARLCAAAFLMAGRQMLMMLEGDAATVRQLRRLADEIEARDPGQDVA